MLALVLVVFAVSSAVASNARPAAGTSADQIAFVPVLRFWSQQRSISLGAIRAAVEGRHPYYRRVLVAATHPSALWNAMGVSPASSTRTASVWQVEQGVRGSPRVLGLLPAGRVRPVVRALGIGGVNLFGADRVNDLAAWPLTLPVDEGGPKDVFAPSATWTLAAAGDVMLDREVYRKAVLQRKGPDYPWNGGFAAITSRTCCTADGGPAIRTRRVGSRGAVRRLLKRADIAIVNHEGPAPDHYSYHPTGLVFTFDPALLKGVARAGIDVVSLGNNHIRNAGSAGVMQTIRNLRKVGIRAVGAGRNTRLARRPACQDQGGVRVCFLAYDAINVGVHAATASRPGAARLLIRHVRADIRKARREGADVVAVVPHWGPEYVTSVTAQQRRWARLMVRAGADVVLGSHSHVTGPVEFVDGAPVLYSMGNFIFDLPRFEQTEEGVIVELTFQGSRLAQMELHPTVFVGRSQTNLLNPKKDGRVVLRRMKTAPTASARQR